MTTTIEGAWALVEIGYRVARPAGVAAVPLAALSFDGAAVAGLTARVGETPVPLSALEAEPRAVWSMPLDEAGEASTVDFRVRYRIAVDGRVGATVRVPVLAVTWPPSEAAPGLFQATLTLPPGRRLVDGFPAGWRARSEGADTYTSALPVLPALVSYRSEGPRPDGRRASAGLRAVLDAGFVFWGLFGCLALIAALYLAWMITIERRATVPTRSEGAGP